MIKKIVSITLFFFFIAGNVIAQNAIKITGKVTGKAGVPLEGATIQDSESDTKTLTVKDGSFTITVLKANATLLVSFVDYETNLFKIAGKTNLNITLKQKSGDLDQVVVIGYGTANKKDVTGSISSVKGSDLKDLPSLRVDQALQGRAAGVEVRNTDGAPGGRTKIVIRGSNSFAGGNDALVVIDGLQGGNIANLNPNDVLSVDILKDASATAIYGSRGANGVIIITTKKGTRGKPSIDYSFTYGTQKLLKKLSLMNAYEFATVTNEAVAANGIPAPYPPFTTGQLEDFKTNKGTDWQDVIYRPAATKNHQLSIGGGNEDTRYYFSGGLLDQEGILKTSGAKRLTVQGNLDTKITGWLKAGVNVNLVKSTGTVPPFEPNTNSQIISNLTSTTLLAPIWAATIPVYDANGKYSIHPGKSLYTGVNTWNPLATLLETTPIKNAITNSLSANIEASITKDLKFKVFVATAYAVDVSTLYKNELTKEGLPVGGKSGFGLITNYQYNQLQNTNQLVYDKYAGKHHIQATAIAEQSIEKIKYRQEQYRSFNSPTLGINGIGSAVPDVSNINETERVLNSFVGRVFYSFKDKYMLTGTYRADGSSVFGQNNKWAYFPSVAVSWSVGDEKFIRDLNVFSQFKIRTSYGITGNQAIGPYGSSAQIVAISGDFGFNYPYYGTPTGTVQGQGLNSPGNPNLKWETTAQKNLGVDLGFFKGRLKVTFDMYSKKTTDLLLDRIVPGYTGYSTILSNIGSTSNKGTELSISGDPLVGKVQWNSGFNISWNKNKILDIGNQDYVQIYNPGGGFGSETLFRLKKGGSFADFNGIAFEGIWSVNDSAKARVYGQAPGMPHYRDVNNDSLIDVNDQIVIGNALPKFIFGWSNRVSYKNFDLSLLVQGVYGNNVYNQQRILLESDIGGTSRNLLNAWTPTNQNTNVPGRLKITDLALLNLVSTVSLPAEISNQTSRYVEDGSYLRLKNVTFGYNIGEKFTKKIGLKRARIYVSGTNLLTITNYSGYDPEVSSFNDSNAQVGVDAGNFPASRIFVFGIDVSF